MLLTSLRNGGKEPPNPDMNSMVRLSKQCFWKAWIQFTFLSSLASLVLSEIGCHTQERVINRSEVAGFRLEVIVDFSDLYQRIHVCIGCSVLVPWGQHCLFDQDYSKVNELQIASIIAKDWWWDEKKYTEKVTK